MSKRELSPAAQAAKMIRAELKKAGIKASVKTSNYSMGSSINIDVDNQSPTVLAKIEAGLDKYSYATFDGMTDCQGIKNQHHDLPQCSYIFVKNNISDEIRQAAWVHICATLCDMEDAPKSFLDAWKFHHQQSRKGGSELLNLHLSEESNWVKPRIRVAA